MFRVEGEFRQSLTSAFRGMPMAVKIQCPTCRDGLITSEAELRRLPNDHTITELLSFVKDTGKSDIQYCSKHQMQPLNFFCEPCIQPVCCDCTVIDHKETKGHVVVNVEEALEKYTPILDDTMADIKSQKLELAGQRDALEQAGETVDQIQQDLTQHIRSVLGWRLGGEWGVWKIKGYQCVCVCVCVCVRVRAHARMFEWCWGVCVFVCV